VVVSERLYVPHLESNLLVYVTSDIALSKSMHRRSAL
jgi:hypothetical protein